MKKNKHINAHKLSKRRDEMKKKMRALLCTLMIMLWITATAIPAMASPKIKEAEYEGNGRVEVDFKSKVKYKNVKVTVTDSAGKTYSTKINKKDSDDLTFTINGFKKGVTYTYKISGVKKKSEKNYSQVTGKIAIPAAAAAPAVKKIDYDRGDREVEFKFKTKVQWKAPKVTITDGKVNYVTRIKERDNDEIEVKVKKLTKGKKYTYTITGVRVKGNSAYTTVTGTFTAKK